MHETFTYAVSICFVLLIKTEICSAKSLLDVRCIMMWQSDPDVIFLSRWHISVLLDKTKKYAFGGMSHVKYLVPKTVFFLVNYLRDHYALLFYPLLHKLILLFLRFEFAQESKNFQKMDIDDVQNRDRRNPFGKIRALLGVLRNFFGTLNERPYM